MCITVRRHFHSLDCCPFTYEKFSNHGLTFRIRNSNSSLNSQASISTFADVTALISSRHAKLELGYRLSAVNELVTHSNDHHYVNLRRALAGNPPLFSDDNVNDTNNDHDNPLVIHMHRQLDFLLAYDGVACDRTMIVASPDSYMLAFPLKRDINESLKECLNQAIRQMLTNIQGVVDTQLDIGWKRYHSCRVKLAEEQTEDGGEAIPLNRLAGNFVVLVGGSVVAAGVCAVERVVYWLRWRTRCGEYEL